MNPHKIKFIRTIENNPIEQQGDQFSRLFENVELAIIKAHEPWLGSQLPISKKMGRVIAEDILDLGIAIKYFHPAVKDYVEYLGYHLAGFK